MRWRLLLAFLAVVTVLAGCATNTEARPPDQKRPLREPTPEFAGRAHLPPPDMTGDGPGSLIDVRPVDNVAAFDQVDATAMRVVYRSTDDRDGQLTEVSGVVAVPPGNPPRDGWPIISVGHPMTGSASSCAPSLAAELAGYAGLLVGMLQRGYVVVMSDYQGLGIDGPAHSLLDSATLGNNLIDGVRAARRVVPATSDRWAAFGTGQGGLAAWATDERAETYGADLDLVGAVALSPWADLSDLADAAARGTLTREQYPLLLQLLQSVAYSHAGIDIDNYRFGLAKEKWDLLLDCAPRDPGEVAQVLGQLRPDDLRPGTQAAADALREALKQAAVPTTAGMPPAPMLVIYGTSDPRVPAAGTERALAAACTKGEPIEIMRRIGDTTTNDDLVLQTSLSWMQSRFDGVPVANICVGAG